MKITKEGGKYGYKKYNTVVLIWGILLLVLQFFNLVGIITANDIYGEAKTIAIVLSILMIVLLVSFLILSLMKKKAGPIIGIVAGALYCTSFSTITIVIAVCFIVSCASMIKELKKES